jgi:O-antigen/teichoic acid export membrane protein
VPGLLPRLLDLGLPHAAAYFLRRHAERRRLMLRMSLASAAGGAAISLLVLFGVTQFPFAEAEINDVTATLLPLLCLYVGLQLARDVSLASLVALERVRLWFAATMIPVVVGPIALLTLKVWRPDAPAPAYAAVLVVCEILGCVFATSALARGKSGPPVPHQAGDVMRFGLRAFPHGAAKLLAARADRLILSSLLPAPAYALYALSLSFRDASLLPGNAYGLTFMNKLTSRIVAGGSVRAVVIRGFMICGGLVLVPLAGFTLLGPFVVPWVLGPAYAGAVPIMSVIIWSALFSALSGVLWIWMLASGRPGLMSVITIVCSLISIALVTVFAFRNGIHGAAIAVVVAAASTFVLAAALWYRLRGASKPAS